MRKRILAMKENPRDRNFWVLLAQSYVPTETRDQVFRIFAASVIGEDPKLFGFDFDKPLPDLKSVPNGSCGHAQASPHVSKMTISDPDSSVYTLRGATPRPVNFG